MYKQLSHYIEKIRHLIFIFKIHRIWLIADHFSIHHMYIVIYIYDGILLHHIFSITANAPPLKEAENTLHILRFIYDAYYAFLRRLLRVRYSCPTSPRPTVVITPAPTSPSVHVPRPPVVGTTKFAVFVISYRQS